MAITTLKGLKIDAGVEEISWVWKLTLGLNNPVGWVDIYFLHSTACHILLGQLEVAQNELWSWA